MSRFSQFLGKTTSNLKMMALRFPAVLALLACITVFLFLQISGSYTTYEQLLNRLIFSGVFGVFFGIAARFLVERVPRLRRWSLILQAAAPVLALLYFFLFTTPALKQAETIRLFVFCFALFALYLFLPASGRGADFGKVALVHFKAVFTALLYGVVLFAGLMAIYYAIDLLLVNLDEKIIGYMAAFVYVFFTPVYYLSLLPEFNAGEEEKIARVEESAGYPKFLNILVSYIMIPLIAAFTMVLAAYFLKIVFTRQWPVGQIGPMVLGYSAVGFTIYILSLRLENHFAGWFRRLFPIVLLPLVCLQMASCYIRIHAYGVTESRYYVVLFGMFSLVCALYLIFSRAKRPGMIVLLAACVAIISILPPIDAFDVSRRSQTARVEEILTRNGMLSGNALQPNSSVSKEDKGEITSIMNYMANMGHIAALPWIPAEYRAKSDLNQDFQTLFGFEPYYQQAIPSDQSLYVNVFMVFNEPMDITGFQTICRMEVVADADPNTQLAEVAVGGNTYKVSQRYGEMGELIFTITDQQGAVVAEVPTGQFLEQIVQSSGGGKNELPASELTIDAQGGPLKVRFIFDSLDLERTESGGYQHVRGSAYLLLGNQ